ncbi:MAG: N-acyl homoserine lactonase family protein [Gemmatimonadales bacterium]
MRLTRWLPLAAAAVLIAGTAPVPPVPGPSYEIYAIQYGELSGFPASGLILGADTARKLDLSMMVWLLRGEGRTILVDAGFYRERFLAAWKVRNFVRPSEAVARFGVRPEEVTDIVVTHMHWDHADGADLFPNARVWVQRKEYEFYRDPKHQRGTGVFPDDVAMFEQFEKAGRLRLVEGDSQTVARGVQVYTGGRHTHESQYVSAWSRSGQIVLASDNVYLYENLERHRPIAATWDSVSNLKAQERMVRLAGDPGRVVPGHDPAVMRRFPPVKPGAVRID